MNQSQRTLRSEELDVQQEAELWASFADSDPGVRDAFCQSWLALQSHMLGEVFSGVVLLQDGASDNYIPAAVWPNAEQDINHLRPAAEKSLKQSRGLLEPSESENAVQMAYPIEVLGQLHGVVVLELAKRSKLGMQEAFRKLHWGIAWIELAVRRHGIEATAKNESDLASIDANDGGPERARLELMIEMVASVVEEPKYQASAIALATELAAVLRCDRVSISFLKGKKIKVQTISNTVEFGKNMNLVRSIEQAMEEALDQQAPIRLPLQDAGALLVTRAHQALIENHGGYSICSVPFAVDGEFAGVITLERFQGEAIDDEIARVAEGVMELTAPILLTKRRDDALLIVKTWASTKEQLKRLFGPKHLTYKLIAAAICIVVIFFTFAVGEYRVTADALIEGEVQRVVVSPQDGFVASAAVRAGDLVSAGQVMAKLDHRDLELERLKLASEQDQYQREYREALAGADRAKVRILAAQIQQAQAQLALVLEQLKRLQMIAPFDGVVVSGDLTQSLGAPVERGEELFVVAPLERYRVVLKVDERQITDVELGQQARLALSSMPSDPLKLLVSKITPVATIEEGRNYFRVEGALLEDTDVLRPGMQGVAKVSVNERKLIWIWARELINWVELSVWKYWP